MAAAAAFFELSAELTIEPGRRAERTLAAAQAFLTLPATDAQAAAACAPVRDAVARAAQPLHRYRCAACAFEAQHYFWQCPGCLSWDSYPPQRLEDL